MRDRSGRRRQSKALYVREMTPPQLHALAMTLSQDRWTDGLTARQEWLWDQVIVQLAYLRSHAIGQRKCTCMLCVPGDHISRTARYRHLWGRELEDDGDSAPRREPEPEQEH